MCGCYRLTTKERYLRDHFGLDVGVKWLPRWNIAPTQMIPTIRQHGKGVGAHFQPHALGADSILDTVGEIDRSHDPFSEFCKG